MRLSVHAALLSAFLVIGASVNPVHATATPPSAAALEAERSLIRAAHAARRLLSLLDQSRRRGDAARVACVDTELAQVNSLTLTIMERRDRLQQAEQSGRTEAAIHERRVIRRLAEQLRDSARRGRECIHRPERSRNRTVVTVWIHPATPRIY